MERPDSRTLARRRPATLADYLHALKRRRRPALAAAGGVLLLALAVVLFWPATYRSTGTILIEQQEVPADFVRTMVSSYADQRIQIISQRVMTSENLLRIIQRYNLYSDRQRKDPREALVQRMRDDIHFNMISADVVDPRLGRPTKATIAFSVSYDSRSPATAARVASELASLYLSENVESRRQLANDTASFLTEEGDRLNTQIASLEAKLAKFKTGNVNTLPELRPLNLQLMARSEEELRETDTRLRTLNQQITYLEGQLAQINPTAQIYTSTGERVLSAPDRLKILKSDYARVSAIYASDHPDVVRMKREIEGLESQVGPLQTDRDQARQLLDAQAALAQARERYAADHPDVVRQQRLVDALSRTPAAAWSGGSSTPAADNPLFIQLQTQREGAANERTSLLQKRATLEATLRDYGQRLTQSPETEREYLSMARELDNSQLKYSEVRQKQMEATLAKNLETESKSERFTLIEPPFAASEPVSPNRPVILVLGALLALGAAFLVISLTETLDTRLTGKAELTAILAEAPLAILPFVATSHERARGARRTQLALTGAAMGIVLAIAAVHWLYKPIDVLWLVAMRKLGG